MKIAERIVSVFLSMNMCAFTKKAVGRFSAASGLIVCVFLALAGLGVPNASAQPANDNFVNAQLLPSTSSGFTFGSSALATLEAGESTTVVTPTGTVIIGASVWYSWTAPVNGVFAFSTQGSSFDTVLAVYTGNAVNALTLVAANDDNGASLTSRTAFSAIAGTTYAIQVSGFQGASGNIVLSWASAAPANDNFVNAIVISGTSGTVSGTTVNATKEGGEPDHGGNVGAASIWYQWTAPVSGQVSFDTFGSNFDTLLGIYTGASVSSLTTIAEDDDSGPNLTSRIIFNAVAGTTYFIAIDGFDGDSGSVTLNWAYSSAAGQFRFTSTVYSGRETEAVAPVDNFPKPAAR